MYHTWVERTRWSSGRVLSYLKRRVVGVQRNSNVEAWSLDEYCTENYVKFKCRGEGEGHQISNVGGWEGMEKTSAPHPHPHPRGHFQCKRPLCIAYTPRISTP